MNQKNIYRIIQTIGIISVMLILTSTSCCRQAALINNSQNTVEISYKTYEILKGERHYGDTNNVFSEEPSVYNYTDEQLIFKRNLKKGKVIQATLKPNEAIVFGSFCHINENVWKYYYKELDLTIISNKTDTIDLSNSYGRVNRKHETMDFLKIFN